MGSNPTGTTDGNAGAIDPQRHTVDLAEALERARSTEGWRQGQHSARTLLKAADLRLVLIAMHAGNSLEEHHAPGRITIHTLSGHIRVTAAGHSTDLLQGHVLTLERAAPHAVEALADSTFLLTIAWPADAGALR